MGRAFLGLTSYMVVMSGPRTEKRNWDKGNKWETLQLIAVFFKA